jgi:outer membrane protein assembly factor BamB
MKRLMLAILLAAVAVAAQNWPQFRGPVASGVADGKPLPATWDAAKNENILWKTPIPGLAHSSPIVWGDRIYVTTAISSDPTSEFRHGLFGDVEPAKDQSKHSFKVYAIDKKTGKILWERLAYEGVPRTKRHPKSSYASSTPVTDGKHIVAIFGSEGMYCYDPDGKLLWKVDLGLLDAGWFYDPDYQWSYGSSPIIYKDMVIVQADIQKGSFVAAYSLKDGKQVWKTMRDELPSWSTPTIYEGAPRNELILQATKFTRGYDPANGKELWRLGPNSEITTPTPIVAQGIVFVTNGYAPRQPIYAVRPGGSGDLTLPDDKDSSDFIAWRKKNGGPYMPTPVAYGDYFYTVNNQGILAAYKIKTGERVYQERLPNSGGGYTSSPVAGDGKIYVANEDGEVKVVKAGEKYEFVSSNPLGEPMMSSPAISDGVLFFRAQHTLFAVGIAAK